MAKTDSLTNEQREIVRAQNDALLFLPDKREDRLALILNYRREKARENDLIAQAKKDSGAGETLKNLQEQRKLKKQSISIINTLAEMEASARAIAVRQIISYAEDFNWVIPDLFDNGAIGQRPAEGDAPVFDSTSEGQRRGGSKAEPRPAPEPAAAALAREIPTLSLADAKAALDVELAKRDGKRGPPPKSLKEAQAAYDLAKALEDEKAKAAGGAPTEQPASAPASPVKDNVVSFAREQASANAAGEDHIREQAAKLAADRAAKENGGKPVSTTAAPPPPPMDDDPDTDSEAVTEAAPAEKPKRSGGRKGKAATTSAAPPPPPTDDDEEADQDEAGAIFPGGPPGVVADAERRSPDFRIG